ncbi:hypothetical protein LP421_13180 [Rhizobium sp. RCAM05350]|nr:hypothetical protein LP421_13180 [Rhizobium sp. RCAM05350]
MTSSIFNVDSVGTGFRASLVTSEIAYVRAGVLVGSTDSAAINGIGSGINVNVQGTLVGRTIGISFSAAANHANTILVGKDGDVSGFATGISMASYSGSIDNRGSIWSAGNGIEIAAKAPAGIFGTSEISNSGTIEGIQPSSTRARTLSISSTAARSRGAITLSRHKARLPTPSSTMEWCWAISPSAKTATTMTALMAPLMARCPAATGRTT